jgi:hypothetical protein
MTNHTRTVRVFLSSTFRDFVEERDLLVRKVFPELRRKCRERQVELVDVDLRWGITETESQQGKVLPICLAEIDRARPYFIGLLGERYGWVPEKHMYDQSLLVEQPWLEEHRGGKSVTELEILHGVLNNPKMTGRAFFYFRDPQWCQKQGPGYRCESPADKIMLETLKERIRQSRFPIVENYRNPEVLAELVKEDLWRLIDKIYPANSIPDALSCERHRHAAYGATRQRIYVGGEKYFKVLDSTMRDRKFKPVIITGQSGAGKSALLANWAARWSKRHPQDAVITHYLGSGVDSAEPVKFVTRLMQEIARLTGKVFKREIDPAKQLEQLPEWLASGSAWALRERRTMLLVLDGLDKVSERQDLGWFPSFWPPGLKLVISCQDGAVLQTAKGRLEWSELKVNPLTKNEQVRFMESYLGRYRKSLTPRQTKILQSHPMSTNPLFLLTVLEEMRVFGVHEELDQRLNTLLAPPPSKVKGESPTVDDVFEHVIARIEEDLGKKSVKAAFEAIWASRGGLYQDELLAIAKLTPVQWAEIQNTLDEALYNSSGKINFGHDYLRKAVQDRYDLTGKRKLKLHRRLSEYFKYKQFLILFDLAPIKMSELKPEDAWKVGDYIDTVDSRVAEELPWQLERGEQLKALKMCLTNYMMFKAIMKLNPYELLAYWARLGADISSEYERAWKRWESGDDNCEALVNLLVQFKKLVKTRCWDDNKPPPDLVHLNKTTSSNQSLDMWGEEILRRVIESNGMSDHCNFREKSQGHSNAPILSVELPGGRAAIVEAMFPSLDILAALCDTNKKRRAINTKSYAENLRGHIQKMAARDYSPQDANALKFHVLFLPAKSLLSAAINGDPDFIVWAAQKYVLVTSPESLMPVVFSMHRLFQGSHQTILTKADALSELGQLASLCFQAERLEEAMKLHETLLRLSRKELGADHFYTLSVINSVAINLKALAKLPEAVSFLRRCATDSPAIYAGVRYQLACYECLSGNIEEAMRLIAEEIAADSDMRELALWDDDLMPIREFIRTLRLRCQCPQTGVPQINGPGRQPTY